MKYWVNTISKDHVIRGVAGRFTQANHGKLTILKRIDMTFYDCDETPIKPSIDYLSFITNKTNWGFKFHFGMFEIPEVDLELIKSAMLKR